MNRRNRIEKTELDLSCSGKGQVKGFCKHGNERMGSITLEDISDMPD